MPQSTVYKELEAMAAKEWLGKSLIEIDQLLRQLMRERQMTYADYRSLLEIYLGKLKKSHEAPRYGRNGPSLQVGVKPKGSA